MNLASGGIALGYAFDCNCLSYARSAEIPVHELFEAAPQLSFVNWDVSKRSFIEYWAPLRSPMTPNCAAPSHPYPRLPLNAIVWIGLAVAADEKQGGKTKTTDLSSRRGCLTSLESIRDESERKLRAV